MMVGRTISELFPKQDARVGEVVLELRNLTREPHTRASRSRSARAKSSGSQGSSASGRSETAQVVFGVAPAQGGEVLVGGRVVTTESPAQAVAHGIAYVPEDRSTPGADPPDERS
jgi:ABC-type sugar transport system ATPase subunit